MDHPTITQWLTTKEAAFAARRSVEEIQRALASEQLKGYRRGERGTWRIDPKDLDAWVRGEGSPTTSHRRARKSKLSLSA